MDSRFPTHYLNDRRVLKSPPAVLRLFVFGTAWSVSNMTDGHISQEDLYLIPFANEDDAETLVASGLWLKTDSGYQVADFARTQTSAASMEAAYANRKAADAERQRRKYNRDKAKAEDPPDPSQTSREDHVRFEGKERKGKAEARKGKASDDVTPTKADTNTGKPTPQPPPSSEDLSSSELGPGAWPLNLGTKSDGGVTDEPSSEALNRWRRPA